MSFTPAVKRLPDKAYNDMLGAMLGAAGDGVGITGGLDEDGGRWLKVTLPPREDQP